MAENRANIIKNTGLITHGSELSRPEGSLNKAKNVNIDEDGVVTPRRGFNDFKGPTTGAETTTAITKQIFEYKDSIIRHYQDKLEYQNANGDFQLINGSYTELRSGYRTKHQEASSNSYFTTDSGIKKISAKNKAALNPDMISNAGGLKAGYVSGTIVPSVGGFLPPESKVAYRILYGTKDPSGNLIYGAPSSRTVITNFSSDVSNGEQSSVTMTPNTVGDDILDGDYFNYSTLGQKYTIYFDTTGNSTTIPQTSDTIGTTYVNINVTGNTTNNNVSAAILANTMASNIPGIEVTLTTNVVTITSTEEGDVTNISDAKLSDGTTKPSGISTNIITDGNIAQGDNATVRITGVIPSEATVDYFYQIYRTGSISVSLGLTINDLDPGDEMNLVYESGLTTDEIAAGEFEVEDTTPDSFRAEALPLYTNEVTGEGILQANEQPPIALDLELFRNYMFYANTKQKHQLTFTVVSVDDLISGSTRFIVGNDNTSRYYTFVGSAEVTDVTITGTPVDGDSILMSSSSDEREYYVWFDAVGDSSGDPDVTGAIGYRIDISDLSLFNDYVGTTVYAIGDKVLFNGLNYTCNTDTTGIDDLSEDPSGDTSNNGFWNYTSNSTNIIADRIEEALSDNVDFEIPLYLAYSGTSKNLVGDYATFNNLRYKCIQKTTGTDNPLEEPTGLATSNIYWEYVSEYNVLNITHTNNGYTSGIRAGAALSNVTIALPSVAGTGELSGTDEGGDVLLSGLISVGQSIDETARSLVKIISKDPDSPVNAYYLSTGDELPGEILLEARSLEDVSFYVAIEANLDAYNVLTAYNTGDRVYFENKNYQAKQATTGDLPDESPTFWAEYKLGEEFTPELPNSVEIESFTGTNTTTEIKLTGHGYTTGDEIFIGILEENYSDDITYSSATSDTVEYLGNIYQCILDTALGEAPSGDNSDNVNWKYISPEFSGVYTVTELDPVDPNKFSIEVATPNTVVDFVPSFSSIFTADVESDNQESGNRVYYSKVNEPEAVPTINFIDIGSKDEEIKRILALRDNLFVLKDDGVYVISGTSAPDWSVRLIDNTRIIAPDSAVVLNNQIYCLTEQGIVRITDGGVAIVSKGIENLIDRFTNGVSNYAEQTFGVSYENDRAYIMFAPSKEGDNVSTQAFRYNIFERTWSRWEYNVTCGMVKESDSKLYVGNGDRNYISRERKNFLRTDFSDRNFSAAISQNGVSNTTVELSSLVDVEVGDVLYQEQDITLLYINNRLLRKMDLFDSGIIKPVGSTMFNTFKVSTGENLATKVQAINDYLVSLDPANISAKSVTLTNLLASVQSLVEELNNTATVTAIKTYKLPTTVYFEAYIKSVDPIRNQVVIHTARPFVEGDVEIYKHINKEIEWNVQHFGDPSALKQVRYMTIMFDQNNFNQAIAKFASDISQGKVEVPFPGKGVSYWGDQAWSAPNDYWGGEGNDVPFRNPVPRGKQKCRYITLGFEHNNAREDFRILGISAVVRAISDRGYR